MRFEIPDPYPHTLYWSRRIARFSRREVSFADEVTHGSYLMSIGFRLAPVALPFAERTEFCYIDFR